MSRQRDYHCPGNCGTYTPGGRLCSKCPVPAIDDRWSLAKTARTVSTPETRRAVDVHLGHDGPARVVLGRTENGGLVTAVSASERETLPLVDRHAAITSLTDAIASGALADAQVLELLAVAERLKGRAA